MLYRAAIAASTNGANNTLVAAVTGKKIRVIAFLLSFAGTVNAKFQSNQSSDLTGLIYGVANVQAPSPAIPALPSGIPIGQFETNVGESLSLNLSAGVAVGGYVVYDLTT